MYIPAKYLHCTIDNEMIFIKDMLKDTLSYMEKLDFQHELDYYTALDTYSAIKDFLEKYNVPYGEWNKHIPSNNSEIILHLKNYYKTLVLANSNLYNQELFVEKRYSFSDEEFESIQIIINKLRDKISNCDDLDDEHKTILLSQLEKLQKEIHKKMSSFDNILGKMVSIGHTLGKTTKEAQPFIDEVQKMLKIIFKRKEITENLPDTSNQLGTEDILQVENKKE